MPESFANRKDLRFEIQLGIAGNSFPSGGNTITLQGLRASVRVDNAGGATMGKLDARIYGVSRSDVNTLTSILWEDVFITPPGKTFAYNRILVTAVDGFTETVVYSGEILNCWAVYDAMPEVYLMIQAQIGYSALTAGVSPISISANTTVNAVAGQIASNMGFGFKNEGVNIAVKKGLYLGNTSVEQLRSLQRMYRFWSYIDYGKTPTLVIVPYGVARTVTRIAPVISPSSGLIGYPAFNSTGINFDTLFNPAIVFGGPLTVESSVPKANGTWIVISMSHQLSSQTPGGPWNSSISAVYVSPQTPIVGVQ